MFESLSETLVLLELVGDNSLESVFSGQLRAGPKFPAVGQVHEFIFSRRPGGPRTTFLIDGNGRPRNPAIYRSDAGDSLPWRRLFALRKICRMAKLL